MATLVLEGIDVSPDMSFAWISSRRSNRRYSTGSCHGRLLAINNEFFNSSRSIPSANEIISYSGVDYNYLDYGYLENRDFNKHELVLKEEYNALQEYFENISLDQVTNALRDFLPVLEDLSPSVLKVELTSEQSLFYSIKKGNYSLYIQHFIEGALEDDEDQVVATMTVFENNVKMPSFAGSTEYILSEMQRMFPIDSTKLFNNKWNGLPF